MKKAHGWTEEQWAVEVDELVARGMLKNRRVISEKGMAALDRAERLTNRLALGPWHGLTDDEIADVARALEPIARACETIFPYPNPIGMPRPWDPKLDPHASSLPTGPRARWGAQREHVRGA